MSYAFGGHGLFPETLREMKDPERWPTVMKLTYGAVVPTYFGAFYTKVFHPSPSFSI
jgi:solute carrier family 36 (proton-coupled amino acid transporter)